MPEIQYTRVATPIGELLVSAQGDALCGCRFHGQKYSPREAAGWQEADTDLLRTARDQLQAYFEGQRHHFELPLVPAGTPFQRAVWHAMGAVPWGQTISYAGLGQQLGRPEAWHAVGAAVARNPLLVICPCHRVLGSDGSLTGYAGGMERKRWLLDHEGPEGQLFD